MRKLLIIASLILCPTLVQAQDAAPIRTDTVANISSFTIPRNKILMLLASGMEEKEALKVAEKQDWSKLPEIDTSGEPTNLPADVIKIQNKNQFQTAVGDGSIA